MGGVMTHRIGAFDGVPRDPYFASTVLLLSGDGAEGSGTFSDESAADRGDAVAGGGNQVHVDTSIKKFGTGSIRFDGDNDQVNFPDSADWTFAGDFTIECWALFDASDIETGSALVGHYEASTNNQRSWLLLYSGSATNALQFIISSNGSTTSTVLSNNWTPTADTFYYICVERSGTTWRLYRATDGDTNTVMVATATSAAALFNSTTNLRLGLSGANGGTFTNFLHGNLDEVRITNGVARYDTDSGYLVPTKAFPRS